MSGIVNSGVANVIKPSGLTSSDVVVRLKRVFSTRRVGHFGTLDPLGAGVLLVGVNGGARLFNYFLNKRKVYYTVFRFGVQTDTLDSSGVVIDRCNVVPSFSEVCAALPSMVGVQMQTPPIYSAKNVGGVRAYDLARRGEQVELAARQVEIFSASALREVGVGEYAFMFEVSGGTYIRSIARDFAATLGTVATMTEIIRMQAGCFGLDTAHTIEEFQDRSLLVPLDRAIDLPVCVVDSQLLFKISNGVAVSVDVDDGEYKVYCADMFFGIGIVCDGVLKISVWLKE